jgi:hypothetical protein
VTFFGLVSQNSGGDDRFSRTLGIICRATAMVNMMHELNIRVYFRERANLGGAST